MITKQLIDIKEQTRKMMHEAKKVSLLFDDAFGLAIYQQFRDGKIVTWHELSEVRIGQCFDLPVTAGGDVKYSREPNKDSEALEYKATFEPDSTLPRHEHDCKEIIYIEKGGFDVILGSKRENNLNIVKLSEGEVLEIPANLPHQFTSKPKEETIIKIKYLKP